VLTLEEFAHQDRVSRIDVLRDFINEVRSDRLRERSASEAARFAVSSRVCDRLISHYGPSFFDKITHYAACFNPVVDSRASLVSPGVRPNTVTVLPSRTVVQPPLMGVSSRLFAAQNTGSNAPQGVWLNALWQQPGLG
jgi:hypothetical protein